MAEEDQQSSDDRTEEATPERRDEFRERGNVAISRELTSVLVLTTFVGFFVYYIPFFMAGVRRLFLNHFQNVGEFEITQSSFMGYSAQVGIDFVVLAAPACLVVTAAAIVVTFLQSRFNFSWQKIQPDFSRINPLTGIMRMISLQALVELAKGIAKLTAVGFVAYLVLFGEWVKLPGLIDVSIFKAWDYWGDITQNLFFGVSFFLVVVAAADYFYNFMSLEGKMKMTKQEFKEEMKRREVDPHVRGRMRRMQRDLVSRRMTERTKKATVLVTNPTHFAVALRYELGMRAPIVIAKGQDFLALRMREIAKELEIPIVENKPLARTLFKIVEIDREIPETLFKAVSEVIRYVFKIKGINFNKAKAANS